MSEHCNVHENRISTIETKLEILQENFKEERKMQMEMLSEIRTEVRRHPDTYQNMLVSHSKNLKEYIKEEIKDIKSEMGIYVTRTEFEPIKKIVYGAVGIILMAVVGGLISLIITK